jgi:protein-disulfide isomerase
MRPRLVGLAVAALAALALISLIVSLSLDEPEDRPVEITGAGTVQRQLGGIEQHGATLGDEQAPVTIDLFNDLQCADCDDYQLEVVPRLVEDLVRPGKAKLTYRHFPMGQRERVLADFGAVAAGEQDRLWQYVQLFFINQDEAERVGVDKDFLERIAAAVLELDDNQWREDFDAEETDAILESDAELALDLRLTAEPAAVVQGPGGQQELDDRPTVEQIETAVAAAQ